MTDLTWTIEDVCSHGRPNHQELVRELREAVGLFAGAMPIAPRAAWEEAVERAGLFPAALDLIAKMLHGEYLIHDRDAWWWANNPDDDPDAYQVSDETRAVLDLVKGRRP
jgi:hypothetical protein